MLNKQLTPSVSEVFIHDDFTCEYNDDEYSNILKGLIHAGFIPFVLVLIFSLKIAFIYLLGCTILYSTVFKSNAKYFFGAAGFLLCISLIFIL